MAWVGWGLLAGEVGGNPLGLRLFQSPACLWGL